MMTDIAWILDSAQNQPEAVAKELSAWHKRGETVTEIATAVAELQKRMVPVSYSRPVYDLCGTGGSGRQRLNLSTALAVKLAQDFSIAKHGNRAASGRIGSFDVIEAAKLPIGNTPQQVVQQLDSNNISFVFAPAFHPALKPLAPIRQSLGHPTIFNFLGPLLNPVSSLRAQVIGVSSESVGDLLAEFCVKTNRQALLVHDRAFGLDDISIGGETKMWEVANGRLSERVITPADYDLPPIKDFSDISGGTTVRENMDWWQRLVAGKADPARQNFFALNYLVIHDYWSRLNKYID